MVKFFGELLSKNYIGGKLLEQNLEVKLLGPNTVAGSARGRNAFRGFKSRTSITLVPNGIRG